MKINDVTTLLPRGRIPPQGLSDEAAGSAIIKYAELLAETIAHVMSRFEKESDEWEELEGIRNSFLAFRWAYPIKLEAVEVGECDRTQGMISGPLFTSNEFPWPEKNGKYREPIAQFYLEDVGKLSDENVGTGLLQLWVGPDSDDYLIRIIPHFAISADGLSEFPDDINENYFENSVSYDPIKAWPVRGCKIYQITGVSDKVLNWDSLVKFAADDYSFDEKFGKGLAEEIRAFTAIIPSDLPNTEPHFLGNFSLIQYDVAMMPRTLLALESKPCFMWGDFGNAQIFYEATTSGETRFTFSWSCQ